MASSHSLIFIGGDPPHPNVRHHLPLDAFVIAADSGYAHAIAMGYVPHELVGDLDSITAVDLSDARDSNINITQFSTDKDLPDTEIAIASAIERNPTHITVVSGGGDRFDHVLGMVHSLASCASSVTSFGVASVEVFDAVEHAVTLTTKSVMRNARADFMRSLLG